MKSKKRKKVRINIKKFLSFLLCLIAIVALLCFGIKQITKPHTIEVPKEEKPQPKEPEYVSLNIMCGGDIMAHMDQVKAAQKEDGSYDFSDSLEYVTEIFEKADLAMANVETTFSGDGTYSGYPGFDSPDALATDIAQMGIDVALFANNHMLDTKLAGAKRTGQILEDAGMSVVGVRQDTNSSRSKVIDVKGVKVGIVAYTYETEKVSGKRTLNGSNTTGMDGAADYINTFRYYELEKDKQAISNEISWCKENGANIVICYFHWGNEYQASPSKQDQELARYAAESGADIIFASHPHVVQKAEVIEVGDFKQETATDGSVEFVSSSRQVPIFYSMGNFISNQRTESLKKTYGEEKARKTEEGIIANVQLTVCLDDGGVVINKVGYIPLWVDRVGTKAPYTYKVIPLIDDFESIYGDFLEKSGHLSRAKAAKEEIFSIVNLVTTY